MFWSRILVESFICRFQFPGLCTSDTVAQPSSCGECKLSSQCTKQHQVCQRLCCRSVTDSYLINTPTLLLMKPGIKHTRICHGRDSQREPPVLPTLQAVTGKHTASAYRYGATAVCFEDEAAMSANCNVLCSVKVRMPKRRQ